MTGNDRTIIVQDRDKRLLSELAVMRIADREQAKVVAGFGSTTRANTRLLALTRAGFLRRFFLGTVGGARKALYALSPRGADLAGVPFRGPRRRQDETLVADSFVAHQLAINEIYGTVKFRPIPAIDTKFVQWKAFYEPLAAGTALIPDGYFEVETPARTLAMFVEVDLGTESRSVWQRKVRGYVSYAVSGDFPSHFGQHQFRVLVVANSERRLASLRGATAAVTDKIFWFTTSVSITRRGFWSAIWLRSIGDQPRSLL